MSDHDRLARLVEVAAGRAGPTVARSYAVLRRDDGERGDDGVGAGRLRTCGRHYSLALVALVEALAAEPSGSPLAAPLPLHDLREAAFFVAAESASAAPDVARLDESILRVDRCLGRLRVPLQATGYLSARDGLRVVLELFASSRRGLAWP